MNERTTTGLQDTDLESVETVEIQVKQNQSRDAAAMIPVTNRGIEPQDFSQVADRAKFMAQAKEAVPKHLRGNVGMCIAIHEMSMEWGLRPYGVANLCYVVNDRLAFEAGLMIAVINKHAGLRQRLRPEYEGDGNDLVCVIHGHFKDEADPCEYRSPAIGTITPKNSQLWKTDPPRQLFYWSARAFIRMFAPQVMLGIFGQDEILDNPHIGAENAKDITAGAALHERLKNTTKSGEGFSDDVVTNGLADGKPQTVAEKPQAAGASAEPAGEPGASEAPGQGGEASGAPRKPGGRPKGSKNKPKGDVEPESAPTATGQQPEPPPDEEPQRMTEAELIDGLKPLTAIADEAEREAQERQAEKTPEPALPKNSDQYEAHAMAYIAAATSADDLDKRWRSEKALRTNCSVESAAWQKCYDACNAKKIELKGGKP